MGFWNFPGIDRHAPALVDASATILSYGELDRRVDEVARRLATWGDRQLGFLLMGNDVPSVVTYLACLRCGHVPLLLARDLPAHLLEPMVTLYRPAWTMGATVDGEQLHDGALPARRLASASPPLHPDLALLLGTSGSTGSAKLVRLSHRAVEANARSIAGFLRLGPGERALTVLPPHYSYGLSVINSHLAAGGCLAVQQASVLTPAFVHAIRDLDVTSVSGVPTTYQMLSRSGFQQQALPSLRTLTQAGGRLGEALTTSFSRWAADRGLAFVVMYGQTEATARISYLPPGQAARKPGSIGIPIPGGDLRVDGPEGELVYRGPNVMLGYAQGPDDLAKGDELHGELRTGDLGLRDDEGYFFVTGRLKRFVKLAGNRVSLDDVEALLQRELGVRAAAGGADDRLCIAVESEAPDAPEAARRLIARTYGIHHSLANIRPLAQLPLLPSGKIDYTSLA